MHKRVLGVSLLALATGMGGAMAADIPQEVYTPPEMTYEPTPVWSWTGFYAGAAVGYGWGDFDTDVGDGSADGFLGGAFIGYNWQLPSNIVLGIEGDVIYKDQGSTIAGTTFETDWNGTLRGRLGYAFDRFQIYGTGGLAVANVEASGAISDSNTAVGWTAGAGVESALTDNVFARVEYRYTDLGSDSYDGTDADFTSHDVMVGVGFKF